jgi:hypothetical protein
MQGQLEVLHFLGPSKFPFQAYIFGGPLITLQNVGPTIFSFVYFLLFPLLHPCAAQRHCTHPRVIRPPCAFVLARRVVKGGTREPESA